MSTLTSIKLSPETLVTIRKVDETFKEFINSNPFEGIQLTGVVDSVLEFANTLPKELVKHAENFYNYEGEEDFVSLEDLYEGAALLSAFVIVDMLALTNQRSLSGLTSNIEEFSNDIFNLVTYHPDFDSEKGFWVN